MEKNLEGGAAGVAGGVRSNKVTWRGGCEEEGGANVGTHVEWLSSTQFWRVQNLHLMDGKGMNKTIKWKPH